MRLARRELEFGRVAGEMSLHNQGAVSVGRKR